MEKVIILPSVADIINTLAAKLFYKNYFSFLENAIQYANNLKGFIYSIPTQKHYQTKRPKYGKLYARYKPNSHTTYSITFDTNGETYLVKKHHQQPHPAIPALHQRHKITSISMRCLNTKPLSIAA
ncbi:MAG: hypothetical protein EAY75_16300 [Bacteroidetes bacterium]|nr:MAG: hypothetical protein EAY75_16300 [Bacteroidota bacterium]